MSESLTNKLSGAGVQTSYVHSSKKNCFSNPLSLGLQRFLCKINFLYCIYNLFVGMFVVGIYCRDGIK